MIPSGFFFFKQKTAYEMYVRDSAWIGERCCRTSRASRTFANSWPPSGAAQLRTDALVSLDPLCRPDEFAQGGAWVSHLVLAETTWVLSAVYCLILEVARAAGQIGRASCR